MTIRTRRTLLISAACAVAGAARAQTQPARLALRGYDPVAYFEIGKPAVGRAEFEYLFDDVRYRFASAEHLTLFRADPERYAPRFGGYCAMGISQGRKFEPDPNAWVISDGRLFVFGNLGARDDFRADFVERARKARENWPATSAKP
jgi:YHS domain-containing protein